MNDLISRQSVIDAIRKEREWIDINIEDKIHHFHLMHETTRMLTILDKLPSVQPMRKKGKWIDAQVGELPVQVCDQCYTFFPLAYTGGGHHYCPSCGADMKGGQDEDDC